MGQNHDHCELCVVSKQSVGFSYCVLFVCLNLVQEEFLVTAFFEVCQQELTLLLELWCTVVHLMELQKEAAAGSRIWSHTFSVLGSCQCGVCIVFEWWVRCGSVRLLDDLGKCGAASLADRSSSGCCCLWLWEIPQLVFEQWPNLPIKNTFCREVCHNFLLCVARSAFWKHISHNSKSCESSE